MTDRLSPAEHKLLDAFRERLLAAAPPGAVRALVVFGSRARGTSDEHSDLDLAVMAAPGADSARLSRLAWDAAHEASMALDLMEIGLAPVALAPEPRQPLHAAIERDGVEVWRA
jgi:predicted nucleotidyltransferase